MSEEQVTHMVDMNEEESVNLGGKELDPADSQVAQQEQERAGGDDGATEPYSDTA